MCFLKACSAAITETSTNKKVATAFEECLLLCKRHQFTGLIGTCWKQNDKVLNQVRIVDANGQLVNAYAKRCLTYGDANWTEPGTSYIVFKTGGLKFGTLICNDQWVTPGFTDGPNPHLRLQQKKAASGAVGTKFEYLVQLPRDREVMQTVEVKLPKQ